MENLMLNEEMDLNELEDVAGGCKKCFKSYVKNTATMTGLFTATGAAIGSVAPGVGTVVGAAGGFIIGGTVSLVNGMYTVVRNHV